MILSSEIFKIQQVWNWYHVRDFKQLQSSPLVRSAFCPMKIAHTSGLTFVCLWKVYSDPVFHAAQHQWINIIMTLPDDTRSPAASVSSPAGPCLRCHRGDTLRIAALTPGGILYVRVRNYFFLTPKHTHIVTHTQTVTRDHSYIRSHTLYPGY